MDNLTLFMLIGWGVALLASMVIEEEQIVEPQPIIKLDRHTVVIPAHSFAPKFIFLGEQWLPAPTESHANGQHRVCLVERARFGRRDSRKGEAYRAQVYRQVAAHTPQFEKVLISSRDTETLCCTSRDTHHVRLQARALAEMLPCLSLRTSATEVQHLRYSLVDYTLQSLENINTERLKEIIADTCNQPMYLLLRIYECTRVPDLSRPSTPTAADASLGAPGSPFAAHEETEGWTVVYEAPPIELGDRSKVAPETIRMHEGARFYYKHPVTPVQPKLFEEKKELNAVLPPQGRAVLVETQCNNSEPQLARACFDDAAAKALRAVSGGPPFVSSVVDIAANTDPPKGVSRQPPCFPYDPRRPPILAGCPLETAEGTAVALRPPVKTETLPPRPRGLSSPWSSREGAPQRSRSADAPYSKGSLGAPTGGFLMGETFLPCGVGSPTERVRDVYPCPADSASGRFRVLCLRQQGLLFENDVLSVSCVIGTASVPINRTLHASVELSIICKMAPLGDTRGGCEGLPQSPVSVGATTGFHCVRSSIRNLENEALQCSVSPIVRAPGGGPRGPPRVIQTVVVTVLKPFLVVPEVVLEVGLPDGREDRSVFALPVVLSQFVKPLSLSPAAALQLWYDTSLHTRLTSVRLSPSVSSCGPSFLEEIVSLGGKLCLIKGIKHRLADSALIAAGELAAIGDMESDCNCIVRFWKGPSVSGATAKLEVKAQDPRVVASLYELLLYLLEDAE
ncbi:uncharacterized protein LOC34620557 [Cyclospora cayetanensis]|uniref:Uncharacterized protein LOC34620557 n=1 Tax=Cyclospora cayetanensis TaxID=88456 RepID=A0A6P6RUC7_9EIME|nr:uncharacterized protein LOC34620557 [Cyclospora cayetanensis]